MRLIGELNRLQEEHGYLRPEDLRAASERLNVPLYRLQGLATFFTHYRNTPPREAEVELCRDMSCHLQGAPRFATAVATALDQAGAAPRTEVRPVSCLGRCDAAPAVCVNGTPLPHCPGETHEARAAKVAAWARDPASIPAAHGAASAPRAWRVDPYPNAKSRYGVLRDLAAADPGAAARLRLGDAAAASILGALKSAGLRGMGGAGFPTSTKWELVRGQPRGPRHVVVNADESEPGTFKDREILAQLPHLVLEGAALAALVAGASEVIVYIRHEYGPERIALEKELARFRAAAIVPLPIEIFVSPGGYILGEETALLEALEDRRGEPRNKPPFPVTSGLNGEPTVINNVETLAMVPGILRHGAEWWKAQGVPPYQGLKFMALSGHVERPGVFEVRMGTPIGELIEAGGGVAGGRPLLALAPGGASAPFLPATAASIPIDFKAVQDAGSMLGSGAVVVVAQGTDLLDLARNVVAFFRNESCGKCVPCRVGSQKGVALLDDLLAGRGSRAALELLPVLGETLQLTSICGLGQVALNPILSVLHHFPGEVERRLAPPAGGSR